MQELDVQPTNPTPYTPTGGMYNMNPTPGSGGLPALSGLTRNINPMAQQLQQQGRGEDTMLVHMTPDEVNDLQGLASLAGTTMTINPNTGLPEAGLLGKVFKKLLPALAGAGLAFIPGVNAIAAAGIVGGGSTLLTGSLKKGLMAGLSAYGGASLARGLGAGVRAAVPPPSGLGAGAGATRDAVGIGSKFGAGFGGAPGVSAFAPGAAGTGLTSAVNAGTIGANAAKTGLAALPGRFATAARAGLPGGIIGKAAPMLAASGLLSTASNAAEAARKPGQGPVDQGANWPQEGPYMPTQRILAPRLTGPGGRGEIDYFYEPDFGGYLTASGELRGLPQSYGAQPYPPQTYASQGLTGFAEGGEAEKPRETSVPMEENTGRSTSRTLSAEETWSRFATPQAKPVEQRIGAIDYAGDVDAFRLMSEGVKNAKGEINQFSGVVPGMKAGATQDFGGKRLVLGEDLRWRVVGDTPKPTTSNTSTTTSTTDTTTKGPGTGTGTNTTTKVTDTTTTPTTRVTDTATATTGPTRNPEAGSSGYGIKTLDTYYTPQFTKVEDFVTEKVPAYTDGTQQTARLEDYIKSYRTSPGPLKSTSLGYAPGQSPSERNRAYALELAKQAEERRRAAAETAAVTATTANTSGGYYYNPADGQTYTNSNFTGAVFNPVTGRFEMPAATGPGYAGGGIYMDDGSFVVDARTVSELGNGSSNAGQELLARLGGRPVKGPGDGVSDSIRANIGGTQEARVARDEVIFPAKAVKKLGGAKKLYALMDKAHKARKKAGRGTDTKLRKGLGAL